MKKPAKNFIAGRIYVNQLDYLNSNITTYFQFVKIDVVMGGVYFKYVGGYNCYFQNEDGLIGFHYPCNPRYLLSKKEVSKLLKEGIIKL